MSEPTGEQVGRQEERFLDPANIDAERQEYVRLFESLLEAGDEAALTGLARELSPGDLSEILRPFDREDTAAILRRLPPEMLPEVLAEIDKRSVGALFDLLDVDAIADLIEEMPSDEATDLLGDLDAQQANRILAAMEDQERGEVTELLQYEPETAGGLMDKEYAAVPRRATCRQAVEVLRGFDEDDLERLDHVYVVDEEQRLVGRVPMVKLLLAAPDLPITEVMEPDPLYVDVDLDQEAVALFCMTHGLVSLPVVDRRQRLVGRITADDVLDVLEDEATEDISRMAGTSAEEFGEVSSLRVVRSRLPWLLGAMGGELGSVMVLRHFQRSIAEMVAIAFFIPVVMAMAGNTGIQTSTVVVRGLATGEMGLYRVRRHLLRELLTALMIGSVLAGCLTGLVVLLSGKLQLALVLALAMILVVLFAAMAGTGIPLALHRLGVDPAVATGPFITTANDVVGLLIYLGLATLWLTLAGP